mgnify:CR=1 FL=1
MKSSFLLVPFLLFLLPVIVTAQQPEIKNAIRYDGVVTVQDLQPSDQAVHPAAARAMARGETACRYQIEPDYLLKRTFTVPDLSLVVSHFSTCSFSLPVRSFPFVVTMTSASVSGVVLPVT